MKVNGLGGPIVVKKKVDVFFSYYTSAVYSHNRMTSQWWTIRVGSYRHRVSQPLTFLSLFFHSPSVSHFHRDTAQTVRHFGPTISPFHRWSSLFLIHILSPCSLPAGRLSGDYRDRAARWAAQTPADLSHFSENGHREGVYACIYQRVYIYEGYMVRDF